MRMVWELISWAVRNEPIGMGRRVWFGGLVFCINIMADFSCDMQIDFDSTTWMPIDSKNSCEWQTTKLKMKISGL
jgi:hypothetical protein